MIARHKQKCPKAKQLGLKGDTASFADIWHTTGVGAAI
jgi:hypothetical protein